MPQVDAVVVLCRELAEALIEVHPSFQRLDNLSVLEMEALTKRLTNALMQAADDEAHSAAHR